MYHVNSASSFIDRPRRGRYLDRGELKDGLQFSEEVIGAVPDAPVALDVPPIYDGPYSEDLIPAWTSGPSCLAEHGREGCVIHPALERSSDEMDGDRLILKNVAEEYLSRKKGTSYQ